VRVWVAPAARVLVVKIATPLVRVAEPMLAEPSRKVTLPVGVPAVEVTLAVSVTAAPAATGLGAAVSTVEVGAGAGALTTSKTAVEVLAAKSAVPA
jgi:hypothetical protein